MGFFSTHPPTDQRIQALLRQGWDVLRDAWCEGFSRDHFGRVSPIYSAPNCGWLATG